MTQGELDSTPSPEPNDLNRPIPHINVERCNACGLCAALCPTQAVVISDDKAVIARPDLCTYCDVCETFCPEGAIGRPFTVVFAPDQRHHHPPAQ